MKMRLFYLIALTALACCEAYLSEEYVLEEWSKFKIQHNKMYQDAQEEPQRLKIFRNNLNLIRQHNNLFDKGLTSYKLGVTKFVDLTHEEFLTLYTINNTVTDQPILEIEDFKNQKTIDLPDYMDWREKGAVTSVKDQGSCGACWSFASTGAMEAYWFIKSGKLVSLSEQNLIDCSYENQGCNWGWSYKAFQYIIQNNGIDTEESYPFEGRQNECRFRKSDVGATASSFKQVAQQDENALKIVIGNIGPTASTIDPTAPGFHLYKSGIFDSTECNPVKGGHIVLVVGYGSENNQDYWLVKNSWGEQWGEDGYIRMARNKNNLCGIATWAYYPII